MSQLLVGFDSAWTPNNAGAIVGVMQENDGSYRELGLAETVSYPRATDRILQWREERKPTSTIILLDQPTIVVNVSGQRPVENLVSSSVSRRHGGVQPANIGRKEMFGANAPVWKFLGQFGGASNPLEPLSDTSVLETYPVLTMIALGWMRPDSRNTGRLPKYNPARKKTFSIVDWRHVCDYITNALGVYRLTNIVAHLKDLSSNETPRKHHQDALDAYLCLLVALHLSERKDCLLVGDLATGYMVVPHEQRLVEELKNRCVITNRTPEEWLHPFVCKHCDEIASKEKPQYMRKA